MGENRETTGRNHHIDAFTMWFAGGGVKAGCVLGKTDELGFGPIEERCHVHDIHATILHLLGLEHTKLTFRFQGRDFRLTDVHGEIIRNMHPQNAGVSCLARSQGAAGVSPADHHFCPNKAAARFWISSAERSSLCVAMVHLWPNGSRMVPERSP